MLMLDKPICNESMHPEWKCCSLQASLQNDAAKSCHVGRCPHFRCHCNSRSLVAVIFTPTFGCISPAMHPVPLCACVCVRACACVHAWCSSQACITSTCMQGLTSIHRDTQHFTAISTVINMCALRRWPGEAQASVQVLSARMQGSYGLSCHCGIWECRPSIAGKHTTCILQYLTLFGQQQDKLRKHSKCI